MPRANKNTLRQHLASLCASHDLPLPADFGSLTVKGLQERINTLRASETPEPGHDTTVSKAHDATTLMERAQPSYRTWKSDPRSPAGKAAYERISAVQKFVARLSECTTRFVPLDGGFDVEFHVKGKGWQSFAKSGATW